MRVYRDPQHADALIIDVKDSPIMQSVLMECDFAAEMRYDPTQQWFSLGVDTYRRLREHLSTTNSPFGSEPPAKRRMKNPVPPPLPVAPPPLNITIFRTTVTQTDGLPSTHDRETQTDTDTVVCVPAVVAMPVQTPDIAVQTPEIAVQTPEIVVQTPAPLSRLIPVPMMAETTMPSPSAMVVHSVASEPPPPPLPPTAPPQPQSEAPTIMSGYMDWKDVCLRRLAIREILREHGQGSIYLSGCRWRPVRD
jgi:hypothetical protein